MTPQQKAEAYVRQQLPELMELSFGCKIRKFDREMTFIDLTSYDNGSHSLTFRAPNGTVHNGTYYTNEIEELVIIGHPIQLQHWLIVLGQHSDDLVLQCDEWNVGIESARAVDNKNRRVYFNLTTGQPATEADYQAFNDIVGV